MKIEFEDVYHGESEKELSYVHDCKLVVKEIDNNGKITEKSEKGIIIQGKDCIYLNAPKIYPAQKSDATNGEEYTPLLTDAQDIVGAINELKKLSEQEGGDDWQPPDMYYQNDPDWKWFDETLDPAANQHIYGVRVFDPNSRNYKMSSYVETPIYCAFFFDINYKTQWIEDHFDDVHYFDGYIINWGDGKETSHSGFSCLFNDLHDKYLSTVQKWKQGLTHSYDNAGDYTITITINSTIGVNKFETLMTRNQKQSFSYTDGEPVVIFAKIGDSFLYSSHSEGYNDRYKYLAPYSFQYVLPASIKFLKIPSLRRPEINTSMLYVMYALKYLELTVDKSIYPLEEEQYNYAVKNQLQGLSSLEKINIDLSSYTKKIPEQTFSNCQSLLISKTIACCELGAYAFASCYQLKYVNLPNCFRMDSSAFNDCANLNAIEAPTCTEITHESSTNIFSNNKTLKRISFPVLTTWDSEISGLLNLVEIFLPSCTVFKGAINNCHSLAKIVVAEGCDFSEATIKNCYSLGQRPDGFKYP